jgi:hypothetical protein
MQKNILLDFQPALIQSLKTYNKEKFVADLMSGLIVGEDNICTDIHMSVERAKQIDDRLKKEHKHKHH